MAVTEPSAGPGRREARERAIGLLYEASARELEAETLLTSLPVSPDRYAAEALRGVLAMADQIADLVDTHSEGWSLRRMPAVDRAIVSLAVWELCERSDVPTAVVIDEAVELAKDYSTERSPAFINGVLDAIATDVRT